MRIVPRGEVVAVEPERGRAVSGGGLYIPEAAREAPQIGTVVAVGPDVVAPVAVGARVVHKKYVGTELTMDERSLLLIDQADVLAVIEDGAAVAVAA